LIGPLDNLLGLFADPSTHLDRFISGAAATTRVFADLAPNFDRLLADSSTTFQALTTPALGTTIDQLGATESLGTKVLTNARPVLADAAAITQALKPGASLLPTALDRLDLILRSATPAFKLVPHLATVLQTALVTVQSLAKDPASTEVFKVLGSSDLATLGASAFVGLGGILHAVAPAQFACNVTGLWLYNFQSALSEGDSTAAWLRFAPVIATNQLFAASTPSSDLHIDPYPVEDSSECQAGNEGYASGQKIGDPGQTGTTVDTTVPPPGVLALGKKAGLVP
jgi:hypothetical protein